LSCLDLTCMILTRASKLFADSEHMSQTKSAPSSTGRPRPRKLDRDYSTTSTPKSTALTNVNHQQTKTEHNASKQGLGYAPSRRRRPKKLHRAPDQALNPNTILDVPPSIPQPMVSNEIEALKDRVESIEAQLHELLQRTPPKLPRRRQRQRRPEEPEVQDEPHEELQKLESELRSARRELEHLRTRSVARSRAKSGTASPVLEEGDKDVEEIPRTSEPLSSPAHRLITMSGSYRLPIPFTASESEVRSMQAGVSSAQRLAQQFLDANPPYNFVSAERAFGSRTTVTRTGSSWSEWYGGYSMSLSRPNTNSSEPNVTNDFIPTWPQRPHQQSLPSTPQGSITSPPARRAPPKLEIRSGKSPRSIDRKASRSVNSVTQSSMAGLLA
jgi:hypothetical protein